MSIASLERAKSDKFKAIELQLPLERRELRLAEVSRHDVPKECNLSMCRMAALDIKDTSLRQRVQFWIETYRIVNAEGVIGNE